MQFNVMPRTGGLAINRENRGKRGVQQHNSHTGEVGNDYPVGMVLDDQLFGLTIVAQHCLEVKREIVLTDGVD